jgi:hypothetical protein
MKKVVAAMLFACIAMSSSLALAQTSADTTDMRALRAAVKADKRALVATTLGLSDAEAKKFWPIYSSYQRSLDAANRIRVIALEGVLSRNGPITEGYARQLAADLLAADEAEVKARRTLYTRLMRAIPAIKAARYLQLESKIRAFQDYDLAVEFPLIR